MNMSHREKPGGHIYVQRPPDGPGADNYTCSAEGQDTLVWEATDEGYLIITETDGPVSSQTVYAPGHWTKLKATGPTP